MARLIGHGFIFALIAMLVLIITCGIISYKLHVKHNNEEKLKLLKQFIKDNKDEKDK